MLVNNILLKNTNADINILYSHSDNKAFIKLLKSIYGSNHIALLEESVFAHKSIDLIICNNRLDILEGCLSLCNYLHVPLLIVEHKIKPEHLHISQIISPNITHHTVAISNEIARSWGVESFNEIIDIDITDTKSINSWKKTIDNKTKKPFKIITQKTLETQHHE